jgi:hypothetical protein
MGDVLAVSARPYDPARPVVCLDEGGKQLIGDVRPPLPTRPGTPARIDYGYERNGMANLFLAFEPLAGKRHVEVTERRASADFARFARRVLDEWYPTAAVVVFVVDNLSTHTPRPCTRRSRRRRRGGWRSGSSGTIPRSTAHG